jgi:ABC-type dipeptide/oligopeptide/nickel transport system permease subunit
MLNLVVIFDLLYDLKKYEIQIFFNLIPKILITESTLSFLGLGIQQPYTSWGSMLKQLYSLSNIVQMPWLISSGIMIICSSLFFY